MARMRLPVPGVSGTSGLRQVHLTFLCLLWLMNLERAPAQQRV